MKDVFPEPITKLPKADMPFFNQKDRYSAVQKGGKVNG